MVTERTSTIGPVGRQVIANIERLRKDRRLSLRALSDRLAAIGRPIFPSVLHRMSQGRRRVDVDDLAALANVFGVSPMTLLAPSGIAAAQDHPAVRAARALAEWLAELVAAGEPENSARARGQADRALRRVQLEVEELLAAAPPEHPNGATS